MGIIVRVQSQEKLRLGRLAYYAMVPVEKKSSSNTCPRCGGRGSAPAERSGLLPIVVFDCGGSAF